MSNGRARLSSAVDKLIRTGLTKLEESDAGEAELERAVEHARAFVHESTSDKDLLRELDGGLDVLKAGAPVFATAAREELVDLFTSAFRAADAGYVEGLNELAFQERRAAMRARTVEAAKKARDRAERLAFLGDLMQDLGKVAIKLLPLLVAAL